MLTTKQRAYDKLTIAIDGLSYSEVRALSLKQLHEIVDDKHLSKTFLWNLRRKTLVAIKRQKMYRIARDTANHLRDKFPDIDVIPTRKRTLKVFLDGCYKEII